jgi:hypothetical protein
VQQGPRNSASATRLVKVAPQRKSNSDSLSNQLGIHLNFGKREKLPSNSLANQLEKNRNLAKLTSPRAYMRARIVLPSAFPYRWESEKRNKE